MKNFFWQFVKYGFSVLSAVCASAIGSAAAPGDLDTTFFNPANPTPGYISQNFPSSSGPSGLATAVVVRDSNQKIYVAGYATCGNSDKTCIALARYLPDGTPDPNFNGKGYVRTEKNDQAYAYALAVNQNVGSPDFGAIYVAGNTISPTFNYFVVVKYTAAGLLDTTFGVGGIQTATFGLPDNRSQARAIAVPPAPKKLIDGGIEESPGSGNTNFAVIRYLPNGNRDTANFNAPDGRVMTSLGTSYQQSRDRPTSMVIQSGGEILVGGQVNNGYGFVRYKNDGSLDDTFGINDTDGMNGITKFFQYYYPTATINSISLQSGDKIVAAGSSGTYSLVTRLTSTGEPDGTFGLPGEGGYSLIPFDNGSTSSQFNSIKITSAGNIIAVGTGSGKIAIACLKANGVLNPQFSDDGKLTTLLNGFYSNQASGVSVQSDGKIVVVGTATAQTASSYATSFLTARFKMDGL